MKNVFCILLLILSVFMINTSDLSKDLSNPCASLQLSSISQKLEQRRYLSTGKLCLIPSMIGAMFFYNKTNLLKSMKENPLATLTLSVLLFNYLIDTINRYQQISQTLKLFEFSKHICRYILYATAIKNTMNQLAKRDCNLCFSEDDFFNILTNQIPLSFNELERFSIDLIQTCIKAMHNFNVNVESDLEENMYLLCKEHVTIQDVLDCYKDTDKEFYPYLQKFYQDPITHYQEAVLALNAHIKTYLTYMIQYQYHV